MTRLSVELYFKDENYVQKKRLKFTSDVFSSPDSESLPAYLFGGEPVFEV
jgi:hypothetical protein